MPQHPSLLSGIFGMRCPNCRKGHMFCNKSIFPMKHLLKMPEQCSVCGQKMMIEVGFYYGTGYVSYALSIFLFVLLFVLYKLLIGISYKDNSTLYYLFSSIAIVLLLQPWMMRFSRVLYLYMFVKYGKGNKVKTE